MSGRRQEFGVGGPRHWVGLGEITRDFGDEHVQSL
jgi:hypothetical protein